jgi:hypothetical protein
MKPMNETDKPTNEMIEQLPEWARNHIRRLEIQGDEAVRALGSHLDTQKPSKVYWEEYLNTGEPKGPTTKRFYVQTDRLMVENCGVRLDVSCHEGNTMHHPCIELRWSDAFGTHHNAEFVHTDFQTALLVARHNLRFTPPSPGACVAKFGSHKFKWGHCLNCGIFEIVQPNA